MPFYATDVVVFADVCLFAAWPPAAASTPGCYGALISPLFAMTLFADFSPLSTLFQRRFSMPILPPIFRCRCRRHAAVFAAAADYATDVDFCHAAPGLPRAKGARRAMHVCCCQRCRFYMKQVDAACARRRGFVRPPLMLPGRFRAESPLQLLLTLFASFSPTAPPLFHASMPPLFSSFRCHCFSPPPASAFHAAFSYASFGRFHFLRRLMLISFHFRSLR
jgi:hypothetical protein